MSNFISWNKPIVTNQGFPVRLICKNRKIRIKECNFSERLADSASGLYDHIILIDNGVHEEVHKCTASGQVLDPLITLHNAKIKKWRWAYINEINEEKVTLSHLSEKAWDAVVAKNDIASIGRILETETEAYTDF